MPTVRPGAPTAASTTATTGLTLRFRLKNIATDATVYGPTATGVAESADTNGFYIAHYTAPANAGTYARGWDNGAGTPWWDEEDLVVSYTATPSTADGLTPSMEEIGALNRFRTMVPGGEMTGTFNDQTSPPGDDVETIALMARDQVADTLGTDIPAELVGRVRGAAALVAAAEVEIGAAEPRQVVIDSLTKRADDRIAALAKEIREIGIGDKAGPGDDEVLPMYSFPLSPDRVLGADASWPAVGGGGWWGW